MPYHLISHHLCPYVQRSVIVLQEKKVSHRRTYIDLEDRPDWFSRVSPLGKVPVLQIGETSLFESQVIVEYLDEVTGTPLHPTNPLERARHKSWIAYGSETLNAIGAFYSARAEQFATKRDALTALFARMETQIEGPYFEGTRFSLVDAAWAPVFRYLNVFDMLGDFGLLDGLPIMRNWRRALAERPTVQSAVPEGYENRLIVFLRNRSSEMGRLSREIRTDA